MKKLLVFSVAIALFAVAQAGYKGTDFKPAFKKAPNPCDLNPTCKMERDVEKGKLKSIRHAQF